MSASRIRRDMPCASASPNILPAMRLVRTRLLIGSLLVLALNTLIDAQDAASAVKNWPQWRGPHATGVSHTANPPLEWSETKNVRWKVEIPGRGFASPVVWGDRVFVLTAVPVGVTGDAQHAPRGGLTAARRPSVRGDGHRSQDRQDGVGARRARTGAARSVAHRQRHVGVGLARSPTASASTPTSSRSASTPTT